MADEFFFDESNPDCRLPKIPRPPVDFVPECFIQPPPPLICECVMPVPPPDPPPFLCPEFETESTVDVFYEDPECEEKTTKIELKFTKVNDDPCEFEVDLDVQIGIPRPPCPIAESEHKTNVGYDDCLECKSVGRVGSAAEVAGLTENNFSLPEPEDDKLPPVFVAIENVVTQVRAVDGIDGIEFVPHLLAPQVTPTPFFKLDSSSGKWLPVTKPVESATVKTSADLSTIPVADAPAGTIIRVEAEDLYERLPDGSWSVIVFDPIDFTDDDGKILTLNDLVDRNPILDFPPDAILRVKLTGKTFGFTNGQLVEVEKTEPDDWVFEEADLPEYLATKRSNGTPVAPGTIVGIAFPTDRYELLPLRTGSGAGVRKTWKPARCKQNKSIFVVGRPRDCADKENGCRLFLFTEITVPIPRQPCPEFEIREFEVNSYINRPEQEDSVCGRKKPKFVIEKKPDDPKCNEPNKCEFDIDLIIDVPIPEVPCPEITATDVVVNTVFVGADDEELDAETCCPTPENIIEVADYAALLLLTRRQADVGSFARQADDPTKLWERIGPLLYIDDNSDDNFDNIDEPGEPADWRPADPCGSRLSIKTIKKKGNCEKQDECRFEVDLRINVPVPRIPCPETLVYPPVVNTGFEDSPCVSCVEDLAVDTIDQMYAIPIDDRNYGMYVKINNPGTAENAIDRYRLDRDMITWLPAPCPKNKFQVTVIKDPPKDCRDPGKCTLAFDLEIYVPVPKPICPQIDVRDFTVSTYSEPDPQCPPEERPECDATPSTFVDSVDELAELVAQDNEIAQVGAGSDRGLYKYNATTQEWAVFIPDSAERRNCCVFSITKRSSSNAIKATVDTLADLNRLRIPDDILPGDIAVVLNPPAEQEPPAEEPLAEEPLADQEDGPWFFRAAGDSGAVTWSRVEGFDPCNPPAPECSFDVDLNICIPIPVVPCPEGRGQQKTHVGYSDEACVNCDVTAVVDSAADVNTISLSQLRPPAQRDCTKGCEQFAAAQTNSGDEENLEPEIYYIGVNKPTKQFTWGPNGFEPSFQERTLSFADLFAGDVTGVFKVDNLSPYFQFIDGAWVPVSPPAAEATVENRNQLDNLPIERVPAGSRIGVAGGGIFERQPNGNWEEVEFNPAPCESTFADIVNGDDSCSAAGDIIQIDINPDDHYEFDQDKNLKKTAKPKPNDWVFDEESIPAYLTERAAAQKAMQPDEIIEVAFPTDRYMVTFYSTGKTVTPARCKKNETVIEVAKNCADKNCKIFLFTEVTVPIPRPPCPEFSSKVRARGFYANGDDEPCGDCGADLDYTSLTELTQNGDRPIGAGRVVEAACNVDLELGTVAQVAPNKKTGEPGSRWRWNPDYGGWQPAPCGENFVTFKKAKTPNLKNAKSKKKKNALCAKEDPGTVYFIEDTNEFYVAGPGGAWRKVSPDDCTESSCQFDVDIDLSVPIPQPPCPIFNTRKADIRVCDEFPRVSLGIGARESKCDPDEPNIQCVFDVDFDLELPCPKFYGAGTSVNMVGPNGAARGSVNFQKNCQSEPPKKACDDGHQVEDALERDRYAFEQLELLANNPNPPEDAFGPGSIVKTSQPLPGGMSWRFLGFENDALAWEVVPCDPEAKNICSFDVDLSIDVPACSSITFAEDDDAGTHTGIAKADRYKMYYLKADDDCPPDPEGDPCVNPDNVNIKVNNEAEKQALLGQPPGKIRRNDDPGGGAHQIRAGEVFKEPAFDANGNQTGFNYARLDAKDAPSQQLTYTPIAEADVPKSAQGKPIARNVANYDVGTLANLQGMLGGPPDPRLVDGAAIQVGADGFGVFRVNGQQGVFVPANVCGEDLFSVVIAPDKFEPCKFRYAQQIRICQRMPDHSAPCTEYHGDPCCDTGCPCTSPPTNPCCKDDKEKEDDGNYSASGQGGDSAAFTARPFDFPVLNMADSAQSGGSGSDGDPDAPGDPCEDYVAEASGGCGAAAAPSDPGYRPFKSIELNIKENFPEDRLTPPKITYQLDVAPNCLHGGEVKISKGKRSDSGGQTTTTPFTQLPTDPDSFDTVTASLPRLDSTGGEAYVACVSKVVASDAIGTGTIEIVNNKINLCLTLYTDECDDDVPPSGPSSPDGSTGSESSSSPFKAAPVRALAQAAPPERLSAALLEDLILAINTHPELKEAIRNIVNQPD